MLIAVVAMIVRTAQTTTTSTRPAIQALRSDGIRKRSRVRSTVVPRRRSCGRTSRMTNSRIIGIDERKAPVQVHLFAGK